MPAYAYRAVDAAGKRQRGSAEAATPAALLRLLEAQGLVVLEVEPSAPARTGGSSGLGLGRRRAVLETGTLQPEAVALYLSAGYEPMPPFGVYSGEPDSRCFAKNISIGDRRVSGVAPKAQ